ncbi:MAG: DNA-3-methyladenine glycosylase 2 family protein [Chloroflexota bacterium]
MTTIVRLSPTTMQQGIDALVAVDADFARVYEQYGTPPEWFRPQGFSTLLYIILEQQVSLQSAKAAYDRLLAAVAEITDTGLTPEIFLTFEDEQLKQFGFSRQKTRYGRILAEKIRDGNIDLAALDTMPDEEVLTALTSLTGIGPWTANIYLLMVLKRVDVWPIGDVALATAYKEIKGLDERPTQPELAEIAEAWRPWRAIAARLLWNHYLHKRAK